MKPSADGADAADESILIRRVPLGSSTSPYLRYLRHLRTVLHFFPACKTPLPLFAQASIFGKGRKP
jgi:hypothetical protein